MYMNLWDNVDSLAKTTPFIRYILSNNGSKKTQDVGFVPMTLDKRAKTLANLGLPVPNDAVRPYFESPPLYLCGLFGFKIISRYGCGLLGRLVNIANESTCRQLLSLRSHSGTLVLSEGMLYSGIAFRHVSCYFLPILLQTIL